MPAAVLFGGLVVYAAEQGGRLREELAVSEAGGPTPGGGADEAAGRGVDGPGGGESARGRHWASEELLPLVYAELRRLAASRLAREPGAAAGYTLQPTALVHEAFLRLAGDHQQLWESKGHFFGAAALAMRRILVERARKQTRRDRLGRREVVTLSELTGDPAAPAVDMLALHRALRRLEVKDSRKYEVVMLRFFAGVSVEQTAELLGTSGVTVKRDWNYARAWLLNSIDEAGDEPDVEDD